MTLSLVSLAVATLSLYSVSALPTTNLNERPIVGVLTQPLGTENSTSKGSRSYIAASYIKWVEMAGARAVPIHFDAPWEQTEHLLSQLNGVLYCGGGADLGNTSSYGTAGRRIFEHAKSANDRGEFFPVWATCLGFEQVVMLAAESDSVLCDGCFEAEGLPLPLDFTSKASGSRMLHGMATQRPELFRTLSMSNLTENSHSSGIEPQVFATHGGNTKLSEFYEVLSTNLDANGKEFVSTVEGKKYPVYATQWHPEKNVFEWGGVGKLGEKAIPHGADATAVSQYLADFFISEARKSPNRFATTAAEKKSLIYNYSPQADPSGYFEQVYIWGE